MPLKPTTRRTGAIHSLGSVFALLCIVAVGVHLLLRSALGSNSTLWSAPMYLLPLWAALAFVGVPLVVDLTRKLFRGEFGSDLLAGISIVTAVVLEEYLAGVLVCLMLSGGEALEAYAVRSASHVLEALAKRMPTIAHRQRGADIDDVDLEQIVVGDTLVVFPHEICPVDGTVVEGAGLMDEAYLTGEPYLIEKIAGSQVLSGAINGRSALTIRCDKPAWDSRFSKIMEVMRAAEEQRPRIRRLGDRLGAIYTPVAVTIAVIAWLASADSTRFLAVLVVATPCPLLIAIPVAMIGSISLAARRAIVVKNPAILEKIGACRTVMFDKTGTLTYGKPVLTEIIARPGFDSDDVLAKVAALERYSKHPLGAPILEAARARDLNLPMAKEVHEPPGKGLTGKVDGSIVEITGRKHLLEREPKLATELPPASSGLECVVLVDDQLAAAIRFRDEPRKEGAPFVSHLGPKHSFDRVMIVSGDREEEVRRLADRVGIDEVYFSQSPEQKLAIVREETARADTVFLGDGINDAPALAAATVGIAFGQSSDVTSEAADAIILDSSLQKVDELLHISRRMLRIALQSAIGGMALSLLGMLAAAFGWITPVAGALLQEGIDVAAIANALRGAWPPKRLTDY